MSLAVIVPLADKVPKENDVVAGWAGFAVFIGLCVAVAVLGWSLTRHLKKAREPWPGDEVHDEADDGPGGTGGTGVADGGGTVRPDTEDASPRA